MILAQPDLQDGIVTLKKLTGENTESLFKMRSNDLLCKQAGIIMDKNPSQTLSFILDVERKLKNHYFYYWGIFVEEILVGVISLWVMDFEKNAGELGYFIGPDHKRQGYMFRAIKLVVNFAFKNTNFKAISAYIEIDNFASRNLVEKLGFIKLSKSIEEDLRSVFTLMYRYQIKSMIL